jgi:ribosome assembly protein YihI (activator of Der GTPase)
VSLTFERLDIEREKYGRRDLRHEKELYATNQKLEKKKTRHYFTAYMNELESKRLKRRRAAKTPTMGQRQELKIVYATYTQTMAPAKCCMYMEVRFSSS